MSVGFINRPQPAYDYTEYGGGDAWQEYWERLEEELFEEQFIDWLEEVSELAGQS